MHSYAQTNIQLLNQLRQKGYSNPELEYISNAYELVRCLFTGYFRASGKTFIAHLVGTASILVSLRMPVTMVAAGLLHASYSHGDFGDGRRGISDAKREQVREVVGKQAEEYIALYTAQPWNDKGISTVHDNLDTLSPIERDILLIRLVNELEEHLDLGILYDYNTTKRLQDINSWGAILVKIAEKLGFATLAAELAQAFEENTSSEIPAQLRSPSNFSSILAPKSYQRRPSVALRYQLAHSLHPLRPVLHRFKQKLSLNL